MTQHFDHSLNTTTTTYSEPFDNVITINFLTDTQRITAVPNIIVKIINDIIKVIEHNNQATILLSIVPMINTLLF